VHTRFGDAVVHEDVSLSVRPGEIFALVGGSGSASRAAARDHPAAAAGLGSIRVFGRRSSASVTRKRCRCGGAGRDVRARRAVQLAHRHENVGMVLHEHTGSASG